MVQLPFQALAQQAINTQSFPVSFREMTGDSRAIVLRGMSLPMRGKMGEGEGVPFGSSLRVNTHYYPGNPIADAQVLGGAWTDTELHGRWSDARLAEEANAATLHNFPPISMALGAITGGSTFLSSGTIPSDTARSARVLRDAFYSLQRGGQLLKVTWGSIARFGFITEFVPRHETESSIYWDMTLVWVGDTIAPQKLKTSDPLNPPGLLATLIAALQDFLNMMDAMLAQIYGNVLALQQKVKRVGTLVTDLLEMVNSFVKLVTVPADFFAIVKQQIQSVSVALQDIWNTLRSIPASFIPRKQGASPEDINATDAAVLAVIAAAQRLGLDVAEVIRKLNRLEESDLKAIVVVQQGQSLRDIARQYYKDPSVWTDIAEYNGLTSSLVPAGTVVRLPDSFQKTGSRNRAAGLVSDLDSSSGFRPPGSI